MTFHDPVEPLRVAVLASHNGSNLRALHHASGRPGAGFELALVVSNNSGAGCLAHARAHDIPAHHLSGRTHPDAGELDTALHDLLLAHRADLLVTAGYLKKLGPRTLGAYVGRALNIHPSLLPRHGGPGMYGDAVHRAVLAAGDRVTGASVHHLTGEYDQGEVVARREVPVLAGDTVETLAARVLDAEHRLLPDVVAQLAATRTRHGSPSA